MPKSTANRIAALIGLSAATAGLTGCITVSPPDKPIEINLTVDIKQEVLVRLQRDVEQLINQNPQAFPQTPAEGPRGQ
ncbi:MAG TPA: YnbE family lipoprotein [Sphingomicrobium sp.]|nr:YnbE family lipoprotein [Sphingomicrobium sp.]